MDGRAAFGTTVAARSSYWEPSCPNGCGWRTDSMGVSEESGAEWSDVVEEQPLLNVNAEISEAIFSCKLS
jgi:hypothetical protein